MPLTGWDWDVVVVGLGALGSAAAWALARRGVDGCSGWSSSTSATTAARRTTTPRIIRRCYHTPGYVAWPAVAYDAWAELEGEAGERLVVTTGGLDLFPAGAAIPPGDYTAQHGRPAACPTSGSTPPR